MKQLNEQQQIAVNSDSEKICVIAAAGSGKTTVLIERICRLVESGVDPSSILALTFTNAAAHEMEVRYKARSNSNVVPQFGTFHSFCYKLLVSDPTVKSVMGYREVPQVASDADIKKYRGLARSAVGTKLSDAELDKSENEVALTKRFQHKTYWIMYKKLLKSANLITFDIMCYDVGQLFIDNHECIRQYKQKYKYVIADEFQDTDDKQWGFISSFTESKLFVVGDAKQNLYSFRGTSSEILKSLASNPEWETIILPTNYRSTQPICDYANRIHFDWGDDPFNIKMISDKPGNPVTIRPAFDYTSPKDIIPIANEPGSTAILCRSNAEVAKIVGLLDSYSIPYSTHSKSSYATHILNSAVDEKYLIEWISTKMSADDYARYLRLSSISDDFTEAAFIGLFGSKFRRDIDLVMQVRKLIGACPEATGTAFCIGLSKIFDDDYFRSPDLMSLPTLADVIDAITKKLLSDNHEESGLYVGTIHSSKGLEYDSVHLVGINGKSFPAFKNEDQMNCFYVGCTRAKTKLTLWVDDPIGRYDQPTGIFD